jgi:hypothetical protein
MVIGSSTGNSAVAAQPRETRRRLPFWLRRKGLVRPLGATALGLTVGSRFILRRARNWGTTPEERTMTLPGDELIADASTVTRGITVDAPGDEVWRWLVQIGQDRGGWYTYDWLENLFALDIHSSDEIREEWQHLAVGDRVVQVPPGWGPQRAGYSMPVAGWTRAAHSCCASSPPSTRGTRRGHS